MGTVDAVSLLIRNCRRIITMDDMGTTYAPGFILVRGGWIEQVGEGDPPDEVDAEVLDASGLTALPGLVNTHHHLFQSLTRALPDAASQPLFGWLKTLLPIWLRLTPEAVEISAQVALAEMLLSGCTTSADHLYLYPRDQNELFDAEVNGAQLLGMRFHPCRGSLNMRDERIDLPPRDAIQSHDQILAASEVAIRRYHDPAPGSMLRVALAPSSPFTVTTELMRDTAELARRLGARLHIHIAESLDEERYTVEEFGQRPVELLADRGWLSDDVWVAHCVHPSDAELRAMAASGTGVAHCPSSNMRLGSGIAPIRSMLNHGVPVGLGVDGSASNDSNDVLMEARQALLLARVLGGAYALNPYEALWMATRGGARCLGRDDIGQIAPGKAADVALYPADGLERAGAQWDLGASLILCSPPRARHVVVNGRVLVRDGRVTTVDIERLVDEHNRLAMTLVRG